MFSTFFVFCLLVFSTRVEQWYATFCKPSPESLVPEPLSGKDYDACSGMMTSKSCVQTVRDADGQPRWTFASLVVIWFLSLSAGVSGCASARPQTLHSSSLATPLTSAPTTTTAQPSQPLSSNALWQPPTSDGIREGKARDYFIKGSTLQMQERYAEAILEYQLALRYDNSPVIHFVMAQNYAKLGKADVAEEELKHSIRLDSTFLPAYKLLGESYISQFKVEEAITTYTYILEREPEVQNKFMLARLYEFRNADKALELYKQLLMEAPKGEGNESVVLRRMADLYQSKGDSTNLLSIAERIFEIAPDDAMVASQLMEMYLSRKQYDKGFSLLVVAEKSLPEADALQLGFSYSKTLAVSYDGSAAMRKASEKFLQYSESRTKSAFSDAFQFQQLFGIISGNIEQEPQSDYYFNRALKLANDTVPELPMQIGAYYFQKRRYHTAIDLANKYAAVFPREARLPFMAALCLSQIDSTERAIQALRRTVALDSNFVDAWSQLGILYNSQGNLAMSDAAYERALRIEPANALVNNNYAYSFSERNINLERAEAMVKLSLKAEPNNPSYLDTMGWILFQREKYKEAAEFIQKAIDNGDASATVYEHLGDAYHKLGQLSKAVQAWREALKKEPNKASTRDRLKNYAPEHK